jgi:CheY-like chemotaxis protein
MHCLIGEDDADLAASWHLNLHDLNTEASEAHSRSQATGRLLIGGDGVAIIDLNLPDGHGLEVAEVVSPRMVDCPMVVLTGSGDFPDEADLRPLRQHRGRVPQNGRHAGYACPRPAFFPLCRAYAGGKQLGYSDRRRLRRTMSRCGSAPCACKMPDSNMQGRTFQP